MTVGNRIFDISGNTAFECSCPSCRQMKEDQIGHIIQKASPAQWLKKYHRPPLVRHPLERSIPWSIISCLLRSIFLIIFILPIVVFLLIILLITWPFKCIYFVTTRQRTRGLLDYLVSKKQCHPFWAFSCRAKRDNAIVVQSIAAGVDTLELHRMLTKRLNSIKQYYRYLSRYENKFCV